jgi:uncharacterized protein with PQ loop repeat
LHFSHSSTQDKANSNPAENNKLSGGGSVNKEQDSGLEKVLSANLARVMDMLKFAETKNAALLTFSSAWVIALFTFLTSDKITSEVVKTCAAAGLPLFLLAVIITLFTFIPQTVLNKFFGKKTKLRKKKQSSAVSHNNLLFFGDFDVSPGFPPLRAGVRWLIDARCWRS